MTRRNTSIGNQSGMASIVVVSILVIILALISLGFARLMDRAISNSLASQLGSAAYYAARSGINDAIAYLAANPTAPSANSCEDLLGTGPPPAPLQSAADAISQASGGVTEYTCILMERQPTSLNYQKIPPFKSQVVRLSAPAGSSFVNFTVSWQSSNRGYDQLPGSGEVLYQQTQWANNRYEPVLRLTVYPIDNDGDNDSLADVASNAKTFFLYPSSSGGGQLQFVATADGTLRNVSCPAPSSANDYHCRVTIGNLGGNRSYFFVRLTPLYQQADIKIEGVMNPGNNPARFTDAQSVIDVTAKSNTSVRRLAARVDTSSIGGGLVNISPRDDAMPENAIRTAGVLCKRLDVTGGAVSSEAAWRALCNLSI